MLQKEAEMLCHKWTTLKAQSDNRNWLAGRAGRLFAAELRNLGNSKSNLTAVNGGFTSMTRGHSPFLPQHIVQCESDIETVVSAHATCGTTGIVCGNWKIGL